MGKVLVAIVLVIFIISCILEIRILRWIMGFLLVVTVLSLIMATLFGYWMLM